MDDKGEKNNNSQDLAFSELNKSISNSLKELESFSGEEMKVKDKDPSTSIQDKKVTVPDINKADILSENLSSIEPAVKQETLESKEKKETTTNKEEELSDRYKDVPLSKKVKKVKEKEFTSAPRKKKAIRTYRDFAIENAKATGGTLASMIISQREKKQQKQRRSPTNLKNVFLSLLSIILVVASIGGVIAVYFVVSNKQENIKIANKIIITPNPQITSEFFKEIYEPDINFRKLVDEFKDDLANTTIPIGSIKQFYFTTYSGESLKFLVNSKRFLEILKTRAPSAFIRTIDDNFTLASYSTVENSPFLLFKVSSYPTAIEAMLGWEHEIVLDLDPIFGFTNTDQVRKKFFEDIILFNKDTRAILNQEGDIDLAYSFIDRQTLIIFKHKQSLKEIISRLQRTIRR